MPVCLAVTIHLHFWQNDQDRLRAIEVTRGWNGHRNKRTQTVSHGEKNYARAAPARVSIPRPRNASGTGSLAEKV